MALRKKVAGLEKRWTVRQLKLGQLREEMDVIGEQLASARAALSKFDLTLAAGGEGETTPDPIHLWRTPIAPAAESVSNSVEIGDGIPEEVRQLATGADVP